ncbi:MAG: hypothetical protein ABEJ83_04265 [Candidatus Nanohaloarchaea archaeon]
MDEKLWKCQDCGRQLESNIEPESCACGSENIEAKEQLSLLEQMMNDFIEDDNQGKS